MADNEFTPTLYKGNLHHFSPRLVAFEYQKESLLATNLVIFIGGLYDGLATVPYVPTLAASLPPTFSLAQIVLSSSYLGWGTSTLQKDVHEISECVAYFRKLVPNGGKIVLMGHSTGCQDCLEYLTGAGCESRQPVDGAILQAPVSDREAIGMLIDADTLRGSVTIARQMIQDGRGEDVLPSAATNGFFPGSTVTASRWLSLVSPDGNGADDLFSSDLPLEKLRATFGKVPLGSPLCLLPGGRDQYVPPSVDRKALLQKWIDVMKDAGAPVDLEASGIIETANHNVSDSKEAVDELIRRVSGFLVAVESDKWALSQGNRYDSSL